MMGFSEEPGIIPRFCEDLFAEIAKKQTEEVCSHGLCKSSYSSREQADRVKVRAEATEADSADGMLWPFPLGPEGERVQTQAVPFPPASPLPRLYHLCGWWDVCGGPAPSCVSAVGGRVPPGGQQGQCCAGSNRRLGSGLHTQPRGGPSRSRPPRPAPVPEAHALTQSCLWSAVCRQPARPVFPMFA